VSGKKWLFDLEETEDQYVLRGVHPELKRLYELDMSLRHRKIKPFTVFTDCLKDTCLPIEKCKIPGKTRVFSISPVQFTITFKQYFLDFLVGYQNARFDVEHAIGIDVNSLEWTLLAGKLCKPGGKIIAGDYKNFGPGLMLKAARKAFDIIIAWYKINGASAEDQQIREILAEEVVGSYHLCLDLIYRTACGIPSGSPITTPLNSLVNSLYVRCVFMELSDLGLNYFNEFCFVCTYGDDIVIGIPDSLCEVFNTVTMSEVFLKYNICFTDADKSNQLVKWRSLDTISFLKCHFKQHETRPGVYTAALDKVSVEGCANWISKKGNRIANTIVNAEMCLELAHGHGREYYEYVRDKLIESCNNYNLSGMRVSTWYDIDIRRYGKL